jgi:hypothetical protein
MQCNESTQRRLIKRVIEFTTRVYVYIRRHAPRENRSKHVLPISSPLEDSSSPQLGRLLHTYNGIHTHKKKHIGLLVANCRCINNSTNEQLTLYSLRPEKHAILAQY